MATHLVTGGTSGIGRLVAHTLQERGDRLVLLARNDDRAERLGQEFPGAMTVIADLGAPDRLAHLDLPDRLDGVVHAAGVVDVAAVADSDPTSLAETVTVNLVRCCSSPQ